MNLQKNLAQIVKTKNKKLRVKYFAANGEQLAVSEVLDTRNNAKKNIIAMVKLCVGNSITVLDLSGHAVRRFKLDTSGKETDIEVQ